ncbi:MAG: FprA family A-type flavoprotein [Promethearchaeota archaeon]
MTVTKLKEQIYYLSAKDWDRRLFDELIPLPDGTSYNSYLIIGSEKTVLIDSADPRMEHEFLTDLSSLRIKKIDYVVANHAEPDHSGSISKVLDIYPEAKVLTTEKGKGIMVDLLLIPPEKFQPVTDGEVLSLGDKTLQFIHAAWIHWPETMLTYLQEDKFLFSCDFLGSHIATSDVFASDEARVYVAAKRYYAEIMMRYRKLIQKHLIKIQNLEIEFIGASHGPVYNRPAFILDAYNEWVSDDCKNEVIIPYASMYGSTEQMVHYLVEKLMEKGITVKPFRLTVTDIGELAMALVDAATIVIASPTVLVGPHPAVVYATYLANALKPKTKIATIIGSYGWKGKIIEHISGMIGDLKVEVIEPVLVKGKPRKEHLEQLDQLAESISQKHKQLGLI